jgi:S-adenosylmethionine decarboxylase
MAPSPTDPTSPELAADVPVRVARKAPGLHLIGDLHGCLCDPQLMKDSARLQAFCQRAVADAGLTSVGALFHSFGQGAGVTGVVVLAESHLSVHTWPESHYVTLDVYVCSHSADNRANAQQLFNTVRHAFQPTAPHLQRIERT